MKFNPIKRILYADNGEIIKKLDCPYKVSFSAPVIDTVLEDERICSICNGEIVDTQSYAEKDLLHLISSRNNLCFKVNEDQTNLRVVYIQ